MTCPPYVTMQLLIELLPNIHPGSVYRFNTAAGGSKRLPAYDLTVGSAQMWTLDTITEWADRNGIVLDDTALTRICQTQQVR